MSDYPECDKFLLVSAESEKIGEFIDWLSRQGIQLCTWVENDRKIITGGDYFPTNMNITELLAQYFDIDLQKIEQEKRAMLEELRELNQ